MNEGSCHDDRSLLEFYLALSASDAGRWNASPEALFLDLSIRRAFRTLVARRTRSTVLNVGIGAGAWDDFVAWWLEDQGRLVSLDRDPRACAVLAYRQRREGHPHPALVVRGDLFLAPLAPRSFDLVTAVGSTLDETGDPGAAVRALAALLAPAGELFLATCGSRRERTADPRPPALAAGLHVIAYEEPAPPPGVKDVAVRLLLASR